MGKDTKAKKAFRTVNSILVGAVLGSVGAIVGSAIIFGVFIYPYLYLFTGFGHPDEFNPLPWLAFAIQGAILIVGLIIGYSICDWSHDIEDKEKEQDI